ncbi:hypothetical protein [Halobacillus sp. Nhm2S1]|uniref:hypothetical protein n=1 Tax=Halobacillus sp. Nhm2S1 TaxID=2866716 RepID=UPI001C73161B|nr:hypothetical protein [Halobacillus sp. Nhm2S1]MBX0357722.1 hypothetical protein [Halobacillus sp. Nhm2S1]
MIGLVFIGNIEYCPYLEKYKQVLDKENIEFEVLYWNRDELKTEYPDNYLSFNERSRRSKKKLLKIMDFIKFKKWLTKNIKTNGYEKIIILDTLSGILISKLLQREYKKKYIFDIRDYSYEKIESFFRVEKKVIDSSYFTCISSEGFKKFLPKDYNYIMAHNFNYNNLSISSNFVKKKKGEKLNIVWIGSVRYYEHQKKIISKLKNDSRFHLIFHGAGPYLDKLFEYTNQEGVKNITFTGFYNNEDKASLLLDADIINNSYDPEVGYAVKYAISNKYYDGVIFKIPQLVEVGTYKDNKVKDSGVGFSIDVNNDNFANILYDHYFNINERKFNENCNLELKKFTSEDSDYIKGIKGFLKKELY